MTVFSFISNRQFNSTQPALVGFLAILNKNPKKSKND
jgi:hypothetical protein